MSELKKVTCHAEGDRCHGCDHYLGKASACKYAPQPDALEAQAKRIAELETQINLCVEANAAYSLRNKALEASLADSNEALQVMGLKLAHAEEENARLWAGHERYEIVRRLNAHQFTELFRESISKNKRFDDLVDALNNQSHSANTVGGPTPVMDAAPAWEMMAIAWLRGKAAGQAQNNERWPDHAKCYPRWTLYVDIAQELANELEREHQKREDTRTAGESDS